MTSTPRQHHHSVSRRRSGPRREDAGHEQLSLPSAPTKPRKIPSPELTAKTYIARRAEPSVVPGHVKLTFTLDIPRELTERLSAQAIREGKNLEAVVVEMLRQGAV
jgi:hypothetical protein